MVPYIIQHPGVRVEALGELFGAKPAQIVADLDLLFLTGVPPYSPSDLIEVDHEGGAVWVAMADYFSRPLRLTRNEAVALYLRGRQVLATPGLAEAPALSSAMTKIEEALGEELGEIATRIATAGEAPVPPALAKVREAIDTHTRIKVEYYTASRDDLTEREIDPERLFSAMGFWYVLAWDARSQEGRTFRIDRIRQVDLTTVHFEPRGLAGEQPPSPMPLHPDLQVRLRLAPGARWITEYYGATVVEEDATGEATVQLAVSDLAWVVKLILRLHGGVEVLAPEALTRAVREEASRALARYH